MEIYVNIVLISYFLVFDFTHVAASNTATDGVTN